MLTEQDLSRDYLTPKARYLALSDRLTHLKQGPFSVDIRGIENLSMDSHEVTLEGVNTSFQVHLRVPYDRYVATFNAAQLVTPLVLALSANSPFLLGKRLWHETRIALFKQSIDYRNHHTNQWRQPSRVNYGLGWLRQSPYEIFSEGVALYPTMLPEEIDDRPLSDFCALRNHMGTIWSWNRAVLDAGVDKHLRIEFRTLPAGPTNIDMVANLAVMVGWTTALADSVEHYITKLPFNYAEFNFYSCAQHGLQSNVIWPQQHQHQLTERRVTEVIADMLPLAAEGLRSIGVSQPDIDLYLGVIEMRLARQQTGAQWQLDAYSRLAKTHDHSTTLRQVVAEYSNHHLSGVPVAELEYYEYRAVLANADNRAL
jgi:gamma-glutamylcysteine synthetase